MEEQEKFIDAKLAELRANPKHSALPVTSAVIFERKANLERLANPIMNKPKPAPAPKKEEPPADKPAAEKAEAQKPADQTAPPPADAPSSEPKMELD